jgi:hypothetical protein
MNRMANLSLQVLREFKKYRKMKIELIPAFLIFCVLSCNQQKDERKMTVKGDSCFFIDGADTINLGRISLKKNLFKNIDKELFPKIQNDGLEPPQQIQVYSEIEGIYINSKIFECFDEENGKVKKNDNAFDVLFIYPEISRYNFQFSQTVDYRIFHYLGFLYQDHSSLQNLPYSVRQIAKKDNNSILLSYVVKSNDVQEDTENADTLILSTFPSIRIQFSDNNLQNFQKSIEYIKLSNELSKGINLSVPANSLPQDIIELYLRELITNLINVKFKTKFKTYEMFKTIN